MSHRIVRLPLRVAFTSALTLSLLLGLLGPATAHHPAAVDEGPVVPGQLLVQFKPGTPAWDRAGAHASLGAKAKGRIPQINIDIVSTPGGRSVNDLVKLYQKNPNVVFAEPDGIWATDMTPNDPRFWEQSQSTLIGFPQAWAATSGSAGAVIAVLDTGVDLSHSEFAGRFVPGWDFFSGDADPSDTHGHGTMVTGIAAQTGNNGVMYAGATWNSPVMPLRVGNSSMSWSAVASALTFAADNGARVATMSFSGTSYSSSVKSAVDYALGKGMFLSASAGNTGTEGVRYPAGFDGVVGVGSVQITTISSFSSFGPHVSVVAPGEAIPTTCLPVNSPDGSQWTYFGGTSASTPFVAGLASLLFSANPELTGAQVADIIRRTATDLGESGWDKHYGWGRIDAGAAMSAAIATSPPATQTQSVEPAPAPEPEPAPLADTTPPTVAITSPAEGVTVSGVVTIRAQAADNMSIARVEFLVNGARIGTSLSAPYSVNWNTRKLSGAHTLTAVAFDTAGNSSTSASVAVTVSGRTRTR